MTANLAENESKTSIRGEIKCSYTWTIKDYNDRVSRSDVDCLESDVFEFVDPLGRILKWRLLLYPKKTSQCNDDHGHILLESLSDCELQIGFTFAIRDVSRGTDPEIFSCSHYWFSKQNKICGWLNFCVAEEIQKHPDWLCDGNLTILCNINYTSKSIILDHRAVSLDNRIQSGFVKDISSLLFDESNSDVEIKCGERKFPCHKIILSARSPVFRAMLQADMEEKRSGKVEIKDYSPDVIQTLLHFIYTGSLVHENSNEEGREDLLELLQAADQYQLDLLKEACEVQICEGVDIQNCLTSLIIGDMYNAENLKKFSMKIFAENMNKVLLESPEDWKNCVKNHPDLTIEITSELAKAKSKAPIQAFFERMRPRSSLELF